MSAIHSYTKYNLHSAAPYICPAIQRPGEKCPGGKGNVLHPLRKRTY